MQLLGPSEGPFLLDLRGNREMPLRKELFDVDADENAQLYISNLDEGVKPSLLLKMAS